MKTNKYRGIITSEPEATITVEEISLTNEMRKGLSVDITPDQFNNIPVKPPRKKVPIPFFEWVGTEVDLYQNDEFDVYPVDPQSIYNAIYIINSIEKKTGIIPHECSPLAESGMYINYMNNGYKIIIDMENDCYITVFRSHTQEELTDKISTVFEQNEDIGKIIDYIISRL